VSLVAGAFTQEGLTVLELLAAQAAISLSNAQLLSQESAARATAEEAERRAAFLAQAGELLNERALRQLVRVRCWMEQRRLWASLSPT
jgi:GAF domain-containing protein